MKEVIFNRLLRLLIGFVIGILIGQFIIVPMIKTSDRVKSLELQIATFQNIHICEDRTHQTCDGDCDCDGLNCDTL